MFKSKRRKPDEIDLHGHPQASILYPAFAALEEAGISFQSAPTLYMALIRDAVIADKLAAAFVSLKKAGIEFQSYPTFYETVIENDNFDISYLGSALVSFKKAGIEFQSYPNLYNAMIQSVSAAEVVVEAFEAFKEAGIEFQRYPMLYEAIIEHAQFAYGLCNAFGVLTISGIEYQRYPTLYEAVIRNAHFAEMLDPAFAALNVIGMGTQEKDIELYSFIANQEEENVDSIVDILRKIMDLHLKVPNDWKIIDKAVRAGRISLDVLTWLEEHKLQKDRHLSIYKACFLGDHPLVSSPYNFSKVKSLSQAYFDETAYLDLDIRAAGPVCRQIHKIIDKVLSADKGITEGPLNKSAASMKVESLIKRIAKVRSIKDIQMQYTNTYGYLLQFKGEPAIYLGELLKLANFNHIELSDEEVNFVGEKIEVLSHDFNQQEIPTTPKALTRLPDAARRALNLYLGNRIYRNINRLFRGLELNSETKYTWITSGESSQIFLAHFLTGCLVNWSAAELSRRLFHSQERQILEKVILNEKISSSEALKQMKEDNTYYNQLLEKKLTAGVITQDEYHQVLPLFSELNDLFPNYGLVDRGERILDNEEELGIKRRRSANPVFTPSVMSLSIFANGSKYFHQPGTVRTQIETDNSSRPVVNEEEGEILVPQGTSYLYTHHSNGNFFAREINSPGIVPKGDYWSSAALAEAYRNHLSQPYQNAGNQVTIAGTTIYRPNHALAHEYRVMHYIDLVIDYFVHHAKNQDFREFCSCITPDERCWLRVAAAFSVTGREDETRFSVNPNVYDESRKASKSKMEAFLAKYPPPKEDKAMAERMLDIVRYMGDPDYEHEYNRSPNTKERQHRNYIHRILSFAHKLDLPRCYGPEEFYVAMEGIWKYVEKSDEQHADYIRMIRYAIDLIDAHGNCLRMELESSGEFIACEKDYRPPFHQVSTNLRQLREITETVPYPKLPEPYQLQMSYAI